MRKVSLRIVAATAAALLSAGPYARAHDPELGEKLSDLQALSEESNLVFVGEVADVKYKLAKIEGGEGTLPFTIVTYSVGEVIRGEKPGNTFAMRFAGGPDGQGGFVDVSGVPKFQPGDKDLLFVKENGEKSHPLAGGEYGRFRIHENAVYNTHGAPLKGLGKSRALARGFPPEKFRKFSYPAPAFDELMKNPEVKKLLEAKKLKLEEARAKYEQEAPKSIEIRTIFPKSKPAGGPDALGKEEAAAQQAAAGAPAADTAPAKVTVESQASLATLKLAELKLVDPKFAQLKIADAKRAELLFRDPELTLERRAVPLDRFQSEVKATVGKAKRQPALLKSIDTKEEIVIKFTGPTTPGKGAQAATGAPSGAAAPSAEDEAEVKALKAQDFDPVLKKKEK